MNYATKEELKSVAKEYCKQNGYEFLFVSDDETSFGYDMSGNGDFVHKSFIDLANELGADIKLGGN